MSGFRKRPAGDPTDLVRQFGANLRECRKEEGLTPEDLAAAADMGLELLIELEEAGGAIPSIGLVLRLAGSLGRRPSVLVAGVNWVPYVVVEGEGRFEVVEDAELVAEIEALKKTSPATRSRAGRGSS
jgi:transcriptional regulator with XRE-family HTH domain